MRSTKHIEKSIAYKFIKPWLFDGLITSGGNNDELDIIISN